MRVLELYDWIDSFAPFGNAESFDNVGLLIGDENQKVDGILLTLDMTRETIEEAISWGANTIITHHPVIFHPLKKLHTGDLVFDAIKAGLNVISAHTNLDKSILGVNTALIQKLDLPNPTPLQVVNPERLDYGIGCLSQLEIAVDGHELAKQIQTALGCSGVRYTTVQRPIRRIAVIGGSGGSMLKLAFNAQADCLITGDVKHDVFYEAEQLGIMLVDAGHYFTEAPIMEQLYQALLPLFAEDELKISTSHRPPFVTLP